MANHQIQSLQDFFTLCHEEFFKEQQGTWVFRGHSKSSYELIPSIGRVKFTSETFKKFENSLITSFKREAHQYIHRQPSNEFEWLAIAQHHMLPTRLLDWSRNPLVALFFSSCANPEFDGELIALRSTKTLSEESLYTRSPYEVEKVLKVMPAMVSPRMTAQEGVFTIFTDPQSTLECQMRPGWNLKRYKVSKSSKRIITYELYRSGINRFSLFPGLDGLGEHLRWRHETTPIE